MGPARIRQILPYASAAAAAATPFFVGFHWIRKSFWFGDDFAFMEDIDHLGFFRWWPQQFGENYIPLFKLLWGAVIFGGHGSALVALVVNGMTHALNAVLFVRLLRSAEFSRLASFTGAAVFGIAVANIEVLTWSMGWATILACTFLLLALQSESVWGRDKSSKTLQTIGWIFAGTLSHARGIVGGPAAAAMAITTSPRNSGPWGARCKRAFFLLIPTLLTGVAIVVLAPANHHEVLTSLALAVRGLHFAVWYFAGNPFIPLLGANPQSWTSIPISEAQIYLLGITKLFLITGAIWGSSGQRRVILVGLVTADLCTAGLLGIGRSFGDASLAMSSRYQYGSLLCNIPVALAAVSALVRCTRLPTKAAPTLLWTTVIIILTINLRLWYQLLPSWTDWRSEGTRRILDSTTNPQGHDLPGAAFITNGEGRRLEARFHLH